MTAETKTAVEVAEKYLKLSEAEKMFVIGVMQGIMLKTEQKPKSA